MSPSGSSSDSSVPEYAVAFDEDGRLCVNHPMLADKLKKLLRSGALTVVIGPKPPGPMTAGSCPIPPDPVPPVLDCAPLDDIYHLMEAPPP